RGRRELVGAARQDVALLVQAVDAADALGVHEVGRVPPARGIEDEVVRPLVGVGLRLRAGRHGEPERDRQAEADQGTLLEEIASLHEVYSSRNREIYRFMAALIPATCDELHPNSRASW